MIEVRFYAPGSIEDRQLKFAVVMASFDGKWIFCRHKSRTTWEIPGGHREAGETIDETARRELWEETGIKTTNIQAVSVYGVYDGKCETFGMLFYAAVDELAAPNQNFEIAEISLRSGLPNELTYPLIQPHLFEYVARHCEAKRRKMLVVPYDLRWKTQFLEIKTTLERVFDGVDANIIHFGSTSIEGMCAKPIIDVMVLVDSILSVDAKNDQMSAIGYTSKGEHGIAGRRYFQKLSADGVTHVEHVHCYEKSNPRALEQLRFCQYLSVDQDAFEAYRDVKLEAMDKYRNDPEGYAKHKEPCISEIMRKAKLYFGL